MKGSDTDPVKKIMFEWTHFESYKRNMNYLSQPENMQEAKIRPAKAGIWKGLHEMLT